MPRLILAILLLLISLLTVLPIPAKQVWYLGIAVAEFPWVWMILDALLLLWIARQVKYRLPALALSIVSLMLFSLPVVRAYSIARDLDSRLTAAFGIKGDPLQAPHRTTPFSMAQMISGIGAKKVSFTTHQYAPGGTEHSLNFYPSQIPGKRPCLIVVHGGSWKSGKQQRAAGCGLLLRKGRLPGGDDQLPACTELQKSRAAGRCSCRIRMAARECCGAEY